MGTGNLFLWGALLQQHLPKAYPFYESNILKTVFLNLSYTHLIDWNCCQDPLRP